MNSINGVILEKQQKPKDKKSDFKNKWLIPLFEGFIGSLGVTAALVITLVSWFIKITKKEKS